MVNVAAVVAVDVVAAGLVAAGAVAEDVSVCSVLHTT